MTLQLLNDRYQVLQVLGAGGFGETFLAEDTYLPSKRRCVVKQLRPIQNNPQIYQLVQERFQREAVMLEALGGATEQIPGLYAYFSSEGQFYLVQEWVEGDTLTAKIQQQGLFTESGIQELLVNLLPVLDYIHSQHIVHRDIKPDNIILRHRDGKPVLIDFGAVRESMGTVLNSQGNPTSSIVIGTPGFMPSEQAAGRPVYSSDLYSLGLTAIYLLTGRQPQQLETDSQTGEIVWREYAGHLSTMMAEILDKAIAYHPRDRYSTAKAMLDALQSLVKPIPATLPPTILTPIVPISPTIPAHPQLVAKTNNQNGILIGSLIAGGLIGASVIIGQVLTKSLESGTDTEVSVSTKRSNTTPQVQDTPSILPTSETAPNPTPQVIATPEITTTVIDKRLKIESTNKNIDNYAWLSERQVTNTDLEGKNGFELDIMRNTIFAVHGRRFDTPGLQDYFDQQPWYNPQYSPKEFPVKLLSKLEQSNVDYIAKYQDSYNIRYFKK
ncbi:YARHG domain-containing protein [Anabaena cylindrica FACHB-243]|uniref:non-specific serine/threonine protein kinase n=1 Tax=Anabaena cylindrica (strain ATCC 27899 / PCC 7122) TaxID=272123 RepID=K9ZI54_ANACC|nr:MULTISPECIES: YARHG domain-containing protein [Anabaena]AFZ58030.1 serine/threonine protein kinase [Anabaena cylindrica PCC 7122]MBD2419195.1 YARHG domain-containing protein [Anabaena cylindrica FACHB-243]MBY5285256.1 YARHG domain-containing protein [Anabaena sp. CCAP 1446/1C]MBY5311515.1 YARHG domain-containing protein [Anabaena sp. CCAP 1446/1C]MCM2409667.1 YARHG domain-containing protein [Anabaena sp. CCAP 1446/1C]